jgi:hypothetical protein
MNVPNNLMLRFLSVVESGGNAGMDHLELAVAVAVGLENNWLSSPEKLTETGRAFVTGKLGPRETVRVSHPLLDAAIREMLDGGMGKEEFERKHKLPFRSAKVVLQIARELMA